MPRYHFHIRTSSGALLRDEEGVHVPDLATAREEARLAVASFSADTELAGYDYSGSYFEVASEDGRETITVPAFERPRVAA